jgi:hypothetical protein
MAPAKFEAAAVHAAPVYMNKRATIDIAVKWIKNADKQVIKQPSSLRPSSQVSRYACPSSSRSAYTDSIRARYFIEC